MNAETKKRYSLLLLTFAFAAALVPAGCSLGPGRTVTLWVSGNTNGVLEPCECEVGPLGGLAKRMTLLTRYRDPANSLTFDTGGLVDDLTDPGRYPAVVEACRRMGYTAILPGTPDSLLYRYAVDRGPFFTGPGPWVFETGGVTIRVLAFSPLWEDELVEDSFSGGRAGEKADLTLWITYLPEDTLRGWLNRYPHPDLILAGDSDITDPRPEMLESVPLYRCGVDGMDLLEIRVRRSRSGWRFAPTWHPVGVDVVEDPGIRDLLAASLAVAYE
ncbi:MAG TPA: hypothetical protein ENI92_04075 [Bacteroidetes bacterium]|nr:hypothetical protein [Bacteroidota bacterium]